MLCFCIAVATCLMWDFRLYHSAFFKQLLGTSCLFFRHYILPDNPDLNIWGGHNRHCPRRDDQGSYLLRNDMGHVQEWFLPYQDCNLYSYQPSSLQEQAARYATTWTSSLFHLGCTKQFLYTGTELLEHLPNLIKRILALWLQSFVWPDFCHFT